MEKNIAPGLTHRFESTQYHRIEDVQILDTRKTAHSVCYPLIDINGIYSHKLNGIG